MHNSPARSGAEGHAGGIPAACMAKLAPSAFVAGDVVDLDLGPLREVVEAVSVDLQ